MAGQVRRASDNPRPSLPHVSRSFPRMDNSPNDSSPRKRASTMQDAGVAANPYPSPELVGKRVPGDVFEYREDDEDPHSVVDNPNADLKAPSTFDELPIEIRSLTERFLEALSAKVHPSPLTAEALSDLFQEFYERASAQIGTHIASLVAQIGREKSPRAPVKSRSRAGSGSSRNASPGSGGEMLTPSEVAERRKARRLLELKRLALEEAVERAVCEKVYPKIFKHRSTDDEARDEKLRSRTAALAVVGIGLKELHMDKADVRRVAEEKEDDINQSLAPARDALLRMNDEHYPLGKLQHLTAAHKAIVETLSDLFPSSSSADEVLPTLIYTLITSPAEGMDVISNLQFIQRFRASKKVDGEAAYCLVNLEAAISFLETVDLPSLRADEQPEGPPKSSGKSGDTTPSNDGTKPAPAKTTTSTTTTTGNTLQPPSTPTQSFRPTHQRRLSDLLSAQASRIELGRENFLSAADKVYESINGTLENSLQFVFGRFKDQSGNGSPLPKTLEDARRLVSSPSAAEDEDAWLGSGRSSPAIDDPLKTSARSERVLELVGGRRPLRDRSADSARSGGSGKRVAFDQLVKDNKPKEESAAGNLFSQINPLNRFGVPGFARFARSSSLVGGYMPPPSPGEKPKLSDIVESPRASHDATSGVPDEEMNAREALAELRKIKPPKKRFLDVHGASDLRIGEVEELLQEYRRLSKAIAEAIAP